MKILVVGKAGQVAQCLVERAGRNGDLQLSAAGREIADLEAIGSISRHIIAEQPDLVINTAAYTAVDQAEDEPERAFRINADAAGEVASAATRISAGLIHVSTDYVFDGQSDEPYAEIAQAHPLNVYGLSKLTGEQQVRVLHSDAVIVRTAWVFSPFGRNFVKTMMALAEERDQISVVEDQRGNPTSALDLADALLRIAGRLDAARGQIFHVAGSGTASWFELAQKIMAERERHGLRVAAVNPIPTASWPTKAVRPRNSSLDCAKFAQTFGMLPDWRKSVAETVIRLARTHAI